MEPSREAETQPPSVALRRSDRQKGKPNNPPVQHHATPHQQKSALFKHSQELGPSTDWKYWRILSKDRHTYKLLIRESLEIQRHQPTLTLTLARDQSCENGIIQAEQ